MPLFRRIARRGFSNHPFKVEATVISLGEIDSHFQAGEIVGLESLWEMGLVKGRDRYVKILGGGEITKAVSVDQTVALSKSAQEKILAAGGTVAAADAEEGAAPVRETSKAPAKARAAAAESDDAGTENGTDAEE